MAPFSFALECPKCGTINTASNFLFAKKVIKCGTCGEEINVRQSRLISKECPECGKIFIFDQKKQNVTCPHCNTKMQRSQAETVKYQLVNINCPQCGCGVEANKNNTDFPCPLCGEHIHVSSVYEKQQQVKDGTVSIIQYEGDNSTFVWKHPIEDFNMGSQLIVHESQEAVFFLNGQALDLFGPGRHTLDTENLPILKRIYNVGDNSRSPFHAEVYFINKTVHLGIKWGTPDKVRFLEPVSGIPLDIGASGEMSLAVSDARKLLVKLVGTTSGLTNKDILSASAEDPARDGSDRATVIKTLQSFFRAPLVTGVKSFLAQTIREQRINILEIDERLDDLSEALKLKLCPRFEEYGLTIPNFYVTTVVLPEDNETFNRMKSLISERWLRVSEAEMEAEITAAERQKTVEEKRTELEAAKFDAEKKRIEAQAEADAARVKGMSEAEVMAAQGVSRKDYLTAEVQKAYAEGIGNMGSNGGSGGGSMAAEVIGMMAGMSAIGNVSEQFGKVMQPAAAQSAPTAEGWTCSCGHSGNRGNFCEACGAKKVEPWTCECGFAGNTNKFCSNCGKPKPEVWTCSCGHSGNKGKFCEACGKAKDAPEGWDCPACGQKGNKGAFCGGCGSPKT